MARLSGINLRNFKAVGDAPVHLALAPVTLLYGPNGAGKSSILHALHYTREVLERGNLDPDRTLAGGSLDLGGWRALVHQRDVERDMVLGFELETFELGGFLSMDGFDFAIDSGRLMLPDHIEQIAVELTMRWSHLLRRPYVGRLAINLMGQRFAVVEATPDLKNVDLVELDLDHPVLNEGGHSDNDPERGIDAVLFAGKPACQVGLLGWAGALPPLDRPLHLDLEAHPHDLSHERSDTETRGYREPPFSRSDTAQPRADLREQEALSDYLDALIVGPLRQLRDALAAMVAIGPLRELPPRGFQPQRSPDPTRWTSGLAAWDRLTELDEETVAEVDAWMSGDTRLGSGFGVRVERFRHVTTASPFAELMGRGLTPLDVADLARLWDEIPQERRITLRDVARRMDVEPAEIGIGVSQLLPVVVAALDYSARFVAVEQPELHVHPRLQTGLGDLFAFGVAPVGEQLALFGDMPPMAISNGRTFLIETHSEHLALRLLRRIREANEGEADPDAPTVTPAMLSINYALPGEAGLTLLRLRVDETGEFLDRWPEGFFAERRAELF
ncbi:AAA family ATPase [Sphingomonas sp. CFBP9019]|uniref:AAA family ATPase n=1 Tax=Sphingomonas sp. CFBP9019 TaxID=3096532 RepID=UPI002A6ADC71|nr:AAA family ATPase [Sphingomonas sp. CFBP9019]MDY1010330.1 AAA family ATPase [Sphingomonas sp. CFBP9019]